MKYGFAAIAMCFACSGVMAAAPDADTGAGEERQEVQDIKIGTGYSFHSGVMDETIEYFVALPYHYQLDPTQKPPIIYVLDGHMPNVTAVHAAAQDLWAYGPEMPEAIIVGILSNDRRRDYTPVATDLNRAGEVHPTGWFLRAGGGPKYREFLEKEFIPHIEQHYTTNGHRILVGHSLGGLFVLEDLVAENRLFQSYVAIDPSLWFAGDRILDLIDAMEDGSLVAAGNLYVSLAMRGIDGEDPEIEAGDKGKEARFSRLQALLAQKATEKLHVKYDVFPGEDHEGVAPASFRPGLRHVFDGYLALQDDAPPKAKQAWQVRSYFGEHPDELEAFFERYSARVGAVYPPDKRLVKFAFGFALWKKQYENALKLAQMEVKYYPNIASSWMTLGRYHETVGNRDEAKQAYEKALSVAPDSAQAKAKVKELTP